jgi:hypothetical protein
MDPLALAGRIGAVPLEYFRSQLLGIGRELHAGSMCAPGNRTADIASPGKIKKGKIEDDRISPHC